MTSLILNISLSLKYLKLGFCDFGVRKYDDGIGRFTSIDPLFEKYPGWTPYQYSLNNPVNLKDDNGKYPHATMTKEQADGTLQSMQALYVGINSLPPAAKYTIGIVGGAITVAATAGGSALVATAGGLIGSYGFAVNSAGLVATMAGKPEAMEKIPGTITGAIVGTTLDVINHEKNRSFTRTSDFVESVASFKGGGWKTFPFSFFQFILSMKNMDDDSNKSNINKQAKSSIQVDTYIPKGSSILNSYDR